VWTQGCSAPLSTSSLLSDIIELLILRLYYILHGQWKALCTYGLGCKQQGFTWDSEQVLWFRVSIMTNAVCYFTVTVVFIFWFNPGQGIGKDKKTKRCWAWAVLRQCEANADLATILFVLFVLCDPWTLHVVSLSTTLQ
jgi:hypothetical protein